VGGDRAPRRLTRSRGRSPPLLMMWIGVAIQAPPFPGGGAMGRAVSVFSVFLFLGGVSASSLLAGWMEDDGDASGAALVVAVGLWRARSRLGGSVPTTSVLAGSLAPAGSAWCGVTFYFDELASWKPFAQGGTRSGARGVCVEGGENLTAKTPRSEAGSGERPETHLVTYNSRPSLPQGSEVGRWCASRVPQVIMPEFRRNSGAGFKDSRRHPGYRPCIKMHVAAPLG